MVDGLVVGSHDVVSVRLFIPDAAGQVVRMGARDAHDVITEGVLAAVLCCMQPHHRPIAGFGPVLQGAEHAEHRSDPHTGAEQDDGGVRVARPELRPSLHAETAVWRRQVQLVPRGNAVVQEGGDESHLFLFHGNAVRVAARLHCQAVVPRLALLRLVLDRICPDCDVLTRLMGAHRLAVHGREGELRDVCAQRKLLLDLELPHPAPAARLRLDLFVNLLLTLDAVACQSAVELPPSVEDLLPGVQEVRDGAEEVLSHHIILRWNNVERAMLLVDALDELHR
mmetsp:Transcript_20064/g.40721  ORF Transcript_20064/g.40721 Transcript_20064/m.40721 type:complete len:282 (+) Transcript_20064:268-1113(+)